MNAILKKRSTRNITKHYSTTEFNDLTYITMEVNNVSKATRHSLNFQVNFGCWGDDFLSSSFNSWFNGCLSANTSIFTSCFLFSAIVNCDIGHLDGTKTTFSGCPDFEHIEQVHWTSCRLLGHLLNNVRQSDRDVSSSWFLDYIFCTRSWFRWRDKLSRRYIWASCGNYTLWSGC